MSCGGFRVDGRLAWVHCARTGKYTLPSRTRGIACTRPMDGHC